MLITMFYAFSEYSSFIFEAMKKLMEESSAVDLTTVTAHLTKNKNLINAMGFNLGELTNDYRIRRQS